MILLLINVIKQPKYSKKQNYEKSYYLIICILSSIVM